MNIFNSRSIIMLIIVFLTSAALADENEGDKPQDWEQRLEMLRSVPYLGYAETAAAETLSGVVFHDSTRAWLGYNFYSTWATGEVFLLDMGGQPVYRWWYSPGRRAGGDYAFLLPGGELLLINEYTQLVRLDRHGDILWRRRMRVHHEATLAPDGTIYTIERSLRRYRGLRVWFDDLVHLGGDGKELGRWSTHGHLAELRESLDDRSFLDNYLDSLAVNWRAQSADSARVVLPDAYGHRDLDYFHLNSVDILQPTALSVSEATRWGAIQDPFQPGNLLICLRNVNQIAILDPVSYGILWAWGEGQLEWPHHPTMLSDGNILVFDNGVRRRYSRVVELDPTSEEIVWEYRAKPAEDFYSYGRGSAQRLPNGNTLICESDRGRVFEVTSGGEVVWTWLNPLIKGDRRGAVYRMIRWPAEEVTDWLPQER